MANQINEQFGTDFGELLIGNAGAGYVITSGYLRRSDASPYATDGAYVYSTCSADFTLIAEAAVPESNHGPLDFRLYYRIQDTTNYRYSNFQYNAGTVTATHWRRVGGTETQESTATHDIPANPSDNIRFTLIVKGTNIIECGMYNLSTDYSSISYNQSINSSFSSETEVGVGFDPNQKYVANGGTATRSWRCNYFTADDKSCYNEDNNDYSAPGVRDHGGVRPGGSHTVLRGFQWNPTGGLSSGGTHTNKIAGNLIPTGGLNVGGDHLVARNNIIASSGGLSSGGTAAYGWVRNMTGGSSIGGSAINTLASSYSLSVNLLSGGSGAAIREYMTGGTSVGGTAKVNQNYVLNIMNGGVSGGLVVNVFEKQYIHLSIGGSALVSGNSSYVMSGGVTLAGRKFPGGYKFRQKIIIPANTFSKRTEFYLLVRMLPYEYTPDLEIMVNDPNGNVVAHDIRQHCDNTGLVHYGFMADILNPEIDNFWYIYF